jgi:hypothetical protein
MPCRGDRNPLITYGAESSLVSYRCLECAWTDWGENWCFKRQFLWGIRAGFQSFSQVPNKIQLGDVNAEWGQRIFSNWQCNESLHQDRNGDGISIVNFVISKRSGCQEQCFGDRLLIFLSSSVPSPSGSSSLHLLGQMKVVCLSDRLLIIKVSQIKTSNILTGCFMAHRFGTCWSFSTHSHTYHTRYRLLTQAEALCLKLLIVCSQFTIHASNSCWWIAVSTVQSLWSVYFHTSKVIIWLTLVSSSQHSTTFHITSHLLYATPWKMLTK